MIVIYSGLCQRCCPVPVTSMAHVTQDSSRMPFSGCCMSPVQCSELRVHLRLAASSGILWHSLR